MLNKHNSKSILSCMDDIIKLLRHIGKYSHEVTHKETGNNMLINH